LKSDRVDLITEYFTMNGRYYMGKETITDYKRERELLRRNRHKKMIELLVELYRLLKEEC